VPSQTFSHKATADVPSERVWASLDLADTWASISGIDRVFDARVDDDGKLRGFRFDTVVGGKKYVGEATPNRREDGQAIGWNVRNSEVEGTLEVELSEVGEATQIYVELAVRSRSLLSGMFFPVIAGAIGNGLPRAVDEFAASF
jgi:hypothetical protein